MQGKMKKEFIRKKLGNGLRILFEKRSMPVVSISSSVKQGSAYESEKEKGISHFLEHLMFKGTKTRTNKEIAEEIEKKGGVLNAYTGEEITSYWNKLPNRYFKEGIDIASDLILNPRFDPVEFEKEKKVIIEEIKMYHDNPNFYTLLKIKEALYKKPFGLSTTGVIDTIAKMKREDVVNFFKNNYKTNKMFLCIVGNAEIDEIEDYGKRFPAAKGEINMVRIEKRNTNIVEKRKGMEQAHFVLGFHASNLIEKNRYSSEIFNTILAGGMSSRLFSEIREKRGLAYDVHGFLEQGKNYGYQMIYIGTKKENVRLCKEIILKEIGKMRSLIGKDFEEGKEQLIGLRKVGSEESINVMNALVEEEAAGNAEEFYNYDKRISEIKLEDVRKLARIKSYSSVLLMPK
jgi:predicted Zn-dependent peptidase